MLYQLAEMGCSFSVVYDHGEDSNRGQVEVTASVPVQNHQPKIITYKGPVSALTNLIFLTLRDARMIKAPDKLKVSMSI
jgi:hypothetical protein